MNISINEIVSDLQTGAAYLILWIDPIAGNGYWYDLESKSRKPSMFLTADVLEGEADGRYEIQPYTPAKAVRTEESITDTERKHRDYVWNIMKGAVETEPDIYDRKLRPMLLKRAAE